MFFAELAYGHGAPQCSISQLGNMVNFSVDAKSSFFLCVRMRVAPVFVRKV